MFSLTELYKAYNENKVAIDAYIKNKPVENYGDDNNTVSILGMTIGFGVFLLIVFIYLVFYIWAIFALVQNWDNMPDFAKWLGLAALVIPFIPGGPVLTLILVYATKTKSSSRNSLRKTIRKIKKSVKGRRSSRRSRRSSERSSRKSPKGKSPKGKSPKGKKSMRKGEKSIRRRRSNRSSL